LIAKYPFVVDIAVPCNIW